MNPTMGSFPSSGAPRDAALEAAWVVRLAVDDVPPTALPQGVHDLAVRELGPGPVNWGTAASRRVARRVTRGEPSLPGDASRAAVELMMLAALGRLAHRDLEHVVRPALRAMVEEGFRRGTTVAAALRALNLAQAGLTEALLRECEDAVPDAEQPAAMRQVTTEIVSMHEELADAIAESRARHGSACAEGGPRESRVVSELLRGLLSPERFERATGYRLDRIQVAAVASSRVHAPKKLSEQALSVLKGMGCSQVLKVEVAPNVIWAWGNVVSADDLILRPPAPCERSTVTVGLPGRGLPGFAASHDEARALQRMVALAGWRNLGRSLPYSDYGVVAELAARPERLQRFLAQQLGNLLGDSAKDRDLRSTALEYLNVNRSQTEAARRLHISKNTVSYRLHRVEELLGRDLGTDLGPLHTALLATDVLGSRPVRAA